MRNVVLRALVADDSAVVRHRVQTALAAAGVEVTVFDGFRAAAQADGRNFDFALLDLDLGDGDGATLAEGLRARAPSLFVAFFTSETSGPLVERATTLGLCFTKPDELDVAIRHCLAAVPTR